MVQSIWLKFKKEDIDKKTIPIIINTIKDRYKTYSYLSDVHINTHHFELLDINQIKKIIKKLGLKVDGTKRCKCGCYSTDLEIITHFLDLDFHYGKILKHIPTVSQRFEYFEIGRDITLSVGMSYERFNILRYILEDIQKHLEQKGIESTLDLSDCKEEFVDYFSEKARERREKMFENFLKRIERTPECTIREQLEKIGEPYVDTPGFYQKDAKYYDHDVIRFYEDNAREALRFYRRIFEEHGNEFWRN